LLLAIEQMTATNLLQQTLDFRLMKAPWHGVQQAAQVMCTVFKHQKDTADQLVISTCDVKQMQV